MSTVPRLKILALAPAYLSASSWITLPLTYYASGLLDVYEFCKYAIFSPISSSL